MIDTLYTLKAIPVRASIRDSILTHTTLSGGLDIDGIDSLNLVLSGTPSVNVVMPEQTDWAMIIGFVSIFANILVLAITIWSNKRLQQHETEEIRTRTIQDIAIKKQAQLFKKLVNINNLLQNQDEDTEDEEIDNFFQGLSKKALTDNINEAQLFISQNRLYINETLQNIATELLNLYSKQNNILDIETITVINEKIQEYCERYNAPYVKWQTRILRYLCKQYESLKQKMKSLKKQKWFRKGK